MTVIMNACGLQSVVAPYVILAAILLTGFGVVNALSILQR